MSSNRPSRLTQRNPLPSNNLIDGDGDTDRSSEGEGMACRGYTVLSRAPARRLNPWDSADRPELAPPAEMGPRFTFED